jgi:hypothetical protein
MILKNSTEKPWYREPWPWLLMSGPAIVVVAGIYTAYLAIVSNDGLVADDYYKQGLAVNQMVARTQQANQMALLAEVVRSDDGTALRVFLRGNERVVFPSSLTLHITHPTRSGLDQDVALRADGVGVYAGKMTTPLTGRWHIALEDAQHEWRLTGDWSVEKQPSLQLGGAVQSKEVIGLHSVKKGG